MYYEDTLAFLQDYPSPDSTWELVEKIGKACLILLYLTILLPPCKGEGNYGVVFKGRNRKTGRIGAVKIMDAVLDKEEDIQAELNVFQKYSSHDNIVDCYGLYLKTQDNSTDQLWIVMEVSKDLSLSSCFNNVLLALCRRISD